MADTLLHITLAREMVAQPTLSPNIRRVIETHIDDFLFGSVVFDLPYYDQILLSGIRIIQKKPLKYHPFGQSIHETHCKEICISLIESASTESETALALGALTHFAVDIVFHPQIERQIQTLPISHDTLERQMGLHCHYDILGHSGVGTSYTVDMTMLFPAPTWSDFVAANLNVMYPNAPAAETLVRWQRGLRVFGLLYSQPYFPWLNTFVPDNDTLASLSLALADQAITTGIEFLNATASLDQLRELLPNIKMSNGEPL